MDDLISRQKAIKLAIDLDYESRGVLKESKCREIENRYNMIPSARPKRKPGRWILDRSGSYSCSECMEPCATYVMMKPRDRFCKMCGARMDGGGPLATAYRKEGDK